MKKVLFFIFCLSGLIFTQTTLAATKYCPCPSETGDTASLCQYGDNDTSYNEYNSSSCKTSTYISNMGHQFCGYDGASGLPKYCAPGSIPTQIKYCPCPSEGADAATSLCRYLPSDARVYVNQYSNSRCQTDINYLSVNNYNYCGYDGASGLVKYCQKADEPVAAPTNYYCPCIFDEDNFCLVKGSAYNKCKTVDQLTSQGFTDCGAPAGTKYCPKTTTPTGGSTAGGGNNNTNSNGTSGGGAGTVNPNGASGGGVFGTSCNAANLTIKTLITCLIGEIINPLMYVIIGLAVVTFLNGARKYIQSADKAAERQKGSWFMFYGIIAIAVMVSVWGLVAILTNTFFGGQLPTTGPIPSFKFFP